MATYCTLSLTSDRSSKFLSTGNLPIQFSYRPPVPKTRFAMHKTGDGGITFQGNNPTAGDCIIEWSCPSITRAEYHAFLALYTDLANTTTLLTFTGYWGEVLTVLALDLDQPTVKSTIFDLSGKFHVTAIETDGWGCVIDPVVTFDPDGGTVSPTSKSVVNGQLYGTLPTPTLAAHVFGGWYTAAGGTGTVVASTTYVKTKSNHTIYAKWTDV